MASAFPSLASYLNEFKRRTDVAGWENRGKVASNLLREARPDLYEGIASGVGSSLDPWGHNELLEPFFEWLARVWLEEQAPEEPAWSYGETTERGTYFIQHRSRGGLSDQPLPITMAWIGGHPANNSGWRWFGPVACPESDAPWPEAKSDPEPPRCGCGSGLRLACSTFSSGSAEEYARAGLRRPRAMDAPCFNCGHEQRCHKKSAVDPAPPIRAFSDPLGVRFQQFFDQGGRHFMAEFQDGRPPTLSVQDLADGAKWEVIDPGSPPAPPAALLLGIYASLGRAAGMAKLASAIEAED